MPYRCVNQDGTWRLVNKDDGEVATSEGGEPRDGGGHPSEEACNEQARTINNREYNSPGNNPRAQKRLRNPQRR